MEKPIKGWTENGHVYQSEDGTKRVNLWHNPEEKRPFALQFLSENGVWMYHPGRFKTAAAAMKRGSK